MSHPISSNMEYLNTMANKSRIGIDESAKDYFSQQPSHFSSSLENQWHSVFRRISLNIQRGESFSKDLSAMNTKSHSFQHRADLASSNLHQGDFDETFEDDTLPNLEDIVQLGASQSMTFTNGYFESPFESDTNTLYFYEEKRVHPLSTGLYDRPHDIKASMSDDTDKGLLLREDDACIYVLRSINAIIAYQHKVHSAEINEGVKVTDPINQTKSSAPYYPFAFAPLYLSLLCRDEHARKAVSKYLFKYRK